MEKGLFMPTCQNELHHPQNCVFAKLFLELSRSTQDSGVLTSRSVLLLISATADSVSDLKGSEAAYSQLFYSVFKTVTLS